MYLICYRKKEQLPQSLGFGACAAVLIPLEEETAVVTSKCVGTMTDNVECEVAGIKIALSAISEYVTNPTYSKQNCHAYILTDYIAVIDIVCNQNSPGERAESFKGIWKDLQRLKQHNVMVTIIWCPGHCDIKHNEIADEEAKMCALKVNMLN